MTQYPLGTKTPPWFFKGGHKWYVLRCNFMMLLCELIFNERSNCAIVSLLFGLNENMCHLDREWSRTPGPSLLFTYILTYIISGKFNRNNLHCVIVLYSVLSYNRTINTYFRCHRITVTYRWQLKNEVYALTT